MALLPDFTVSGDATPLWSEIGPAGLTVDSSFQGFLINSSTPSHTKAAVWTKDTAIKAHGANSIRVTCFHDSYGGINTSSNLDVAIHMRDGRSSTVKMTEGDEEWVGFAMYFPSTYAGTASWGVLAEPFGSCHHALIPNYGYGIEAANPSIFQLRFKTGHIPNPGSGTFNPSPPNGYDVVENLLGTGGPRPFTKNAWHYFYYHCIYQARSNGTFEMWHREGASGTWEKIYSNLNNGTALINRAPHPTWIYNDANGTPTEAGVWAEKSIYRVYRGAGAGDTNHDVIYWCDGWFRRQTQQQILDEFGSATVVGDPPDPGAGRLRIGQAQPSTSLTGGDPDTKRVIKRAGIGTGNTVRFEQAYAYLQGDASLASNVRVVIYAADGVGGLPGSFIGMSDQVTIAAGATGAWLSFPFSTPAIYTGDQVYLGCIYGGAGTPNFAYASVTGQGWRNSDTYSDGPSNPFGASPVVIDIEPGIVGDYTLATDTRAPVFQSGNVDSTTMILLYDEALDPASIPLSSFFAVTVNQVVWPLTGQVTISGSQVALELGNPVQSADIVTVAYSFPGPGIGLLQDVSANLCAVVPQTAVSNQTQPAPGTRRVDPAHRVAVARRIDPTDRRAGAGGGL